MTMKQCVSRVTQFSNFWTPAPPRLPAEWFWRKKGKHSTAERARLRLRYVLICTIIMHPCIITKSRYELYLLLIIMRVGSKLYFVVCTVQLFFAFTSTTTRQLICLKSGCRWCQH